jgi:hypothetical protein
VLLIIVIIIAIIYRQFLRFRKPKKKDQEDTVPILSFVEGSTHYKAVPAPKSEMPADIPGKYGMPFST